MRLALIIWHHPIYWYSCQPLLKQWIDMVLEFQWAYGPGGAALVKLSKQRHNLSDYFASVREEIAHQEELLQTDLDFRPNENDHAWDSEEIRQSIG